MNLIKGDIRNGVFTHAGGCVSVPDQPDGKATLGIRPENITVSAKESDLAGKVYSSELLGDSTLLNIRSGDALIAVKVGPKDGREMDAEINLTFDPKMIAIFDGETGIRRA